jgi:hypothetical protein
MLGEYVVVLYDEMDPWAIGCVGRLLADSRGGHHPFLVQLDGGPERYPSEVIESIRWTGWVAGVEAEWMTSVRLATPEEVAAHQLDQAGGL